MVGQKAGTGAEALVVSHLLVAILVFLLCQAGRGEWGDGQVADL